MTPAQLRKHALAIGGAIESAHMGHADFRLRGKIFATLGYPDETRAMVKVAPSQQQDLMRTAPAVFSPCRGAWGKKGSTQVLLSAATPTVVRAALAAAAQAIADRYPRPAGFKP